MQRRGQLPRAGISAGQATQITAEKIAGPSHVTDILGRRTMTLNANAPNAFTWVSAHEFGHIMQMHSQADIRRLSTADKLRAIWILQGGWISGDDLGAWRRSAAAWSRTMRLRRSAEA